MSTTYAIFGAGCFWGVQAAFNKVPGVIETTVGYIGGTTQQPSYEDVLTDRTGHAEAVRVMFDPSQVSYEQLLELYWLVHDPTQGNRQGNDVGSQYRSVIFVADNEQRQAAEASKARLAQSGQYADPITTMVEPLGTFWPAEDYHQDYLSKNPGGYCHVNMGKVAEFVATLTKNAA